MFSLKDRNGTEYWPESLGNSSCNHIYPQWMKDVEYIRDMDVLPVTGFSYGPMKFEAQEAKVKLGPLTCHPDEDYISKKSEIEDIKKIKGYGCFIQACLNQGSCIEIENNFKCLCPPGFTGYTLSEQFILLPINPKHDIRLLRDLPKFFCCEPIFVQNPGFNTLPGMSLFFSFLFLFSNST